MPPDSRLRITFLVLEEGSYGSHTFSAGRIAVPEAVISWAPCSPRVTNRRAVRCVNASMLPMGQGSCIIIRYIDMYPINSVTHRYSRTKLCIGQRCLCSIRPWWCLPPRPPSLKIDDQCRPFNHTPHWQLSKLLVTS